MRRTVVGAFAFLSGLAMLVGCGDEGGGTTVVEKEYQAGDGLALDSGTTPPTFNVDFAEGGTAPTASRSDHGHDADYVHLAGDTMEGALTLAADPGGPLTQNQWLFRMTSQFEAADRISSQPILS